MSALTLNNGLVVVDYSEKANAFFGKTKENKDQLKEWGARFNKSLTYEGEKIPGWIISKKVYEKLELSGLLTQEVNEIQELLQLPAPQVIIAKCIPAPASINVQSNKTVIQRCNSIPAPSILIKKEVEVITGSKEVVPTPEPKVKKVVANKTTTKKATTTKKQVLVWDKK